MNIQNLDATNKGEMTKALAQAVGYVLAGLDQRPEVAIILGSGLGDFAKRLENPRVFDYAKIPHFPCPTVEGHSGKLLVGKMGGKTLAVMQGRSHYYEGYDTPTLTFPVRVLAGLGVETLVLTNACGGVSSRFAPGDLMAIEDHLALFCPSPLRGAHLEELGPRFVDMSEVYTPEYVELVVACGQELGLTIQSGVYGFWPGPTYETAAEIRAFAALGADVVGMSTVPEAIVAASCGLKVIGLSNITNMTCIHKTGKTSHEEVIAMGKKGAGDFSALLAKVLSKI